ncbi:c-type cytochrome [Hydrocarboniclastica marina]|uniref:Cytochrome c n=1 Tax=Hydrocarboniclastica marina TaxID=2259620 RepID=A0A4P7XMX6_9ALTE|nr:cytochrome c [Hydrocarboniclastica marina]MAM00259.1 hypothetical protein [Alteromonadaceae bacterium]QCF27587.1 cytochrome c [Hydrocarboniclastica marina]|tara:strand:- start:40 stop:489 length:450 start_codon:yes stop_codon:yes gene_type:complete
MNTPPIALAVILACGTVGSLQAGEQLSPAVNYQLRCAGCHGQNGMGVPDGGIPPFPGFIDGFLATEKGRLYLMHVPGIGSASLSDAEISGVVNYVARRWGEPDAAVQAFTPDEVNVLRAKPVKDVVALRREVVVEMRKAGKSVPDYPWP